MIREYMNTAVIFFLGCFAGCLLMAACGVTTTLERGATYGAALDTCIIAATNRAQADACRQKVDCQYGEPTCVSQPVKDGGSHDASE